MRSTSSQFEKYVNLSKKVPAEVLTSLSGIDEPGRLADTIAAHMGVDLEEKQRILEIADVKPRLEHLMGLMEAEIDLFQVEKRIRGRVKKQMEKSQREYYLNEQMKAIQKELGEMDDAPNEAEELEAKINEARMPDEAREKALGELSKLKMMSPMSAEASVVRSYLDWMVSVPWSKRSRVKHDLKRAQEILDADHYGLEEVKERIVEYLAVQKRVRKIKGPVLCLVGPPGVGKTSLGESLARATNRKFVRMALGGVRDEAEIRGHRRTYIGSMPGKLLQKMAKAGVRNPLFLLDEIDKMGMDHRGDPASAMLEVLDPEQNHAFNDHYLEVDYDLSDVMFVCTSNTMNIPTPLLDRMEVIRIPGYTEDEKLNIALRYLLPKQVKVNGLKKGEITLSEAAIIDIIRYYTREAGVRALEREIAKVCRKMVKKIALGEAESGTEVGPDGLEDLLGVRKFNYGVAEEENKIGQVTGLAWTSVGGELLTIEAAAVAASRGMAVTLIEMAPRILGRLAAAETADYFRALHTRHGVDIREGVGLERLLGEGAVWAARLSDGSEIVVDMAIVGIGIAPATALAEAAGLAVENGIAVDELGRSSDPAIWAAGDCASFPHGGGRLRLESVPNAIDMAECVAGNILGRNQTYVPKPWFWSDQYDVKLQIAGLNAGHDRVVTRAAGGAYSVWYYAGAQLLAVDAMNDPRAYMVGKRLIEAGQSADPARVADPAVDLKGLLG